MPNFIEELKWREILYDITPDTEAYLNEGSACGYIGFDPTANSLHIGNLAQVMLLAHFQRCGHKPLILVGGATGMLGDPSGKAAERALLSEKVIRQNLHAIQQQLEKFLTFEGPNAAHIVNNYSWFKDLRFLDFARDVGKHITVSYMMAKEALQKRMETGLSFTEFCYQLVQGYDFYWLYKNNNCKLQMGGSDQWGNMVTGIELIRRKANGKAFALTTPLVKKANGAKFGKTEEGNIWLDPKLTSPYTFYQYWLNSSDEEAMHFIKVFTERSKDDINALIALHRPIAHERILQKELAKDITLRVHSKKEYDMAVKASKILFGNSVVADLESLDEPTLLDLFDGVPKARISHSAWQTCPSVTHLLADTTSQIIFSSKGEAKRMIVAGGVSINKRKVKDPEQKPSFKLLQHKYLLIQKGKKNHYLVEIM